MNYFRRKQKLAIYSRLFVAALVLRSFIAPGFMLDASPGNGLAIIFCNGPSGLYLPANDHASHHAHHGMHDDQQQQIHITPACSHWSTSGMLVFTAFFEPVLFAITGSANVTGYITPSFQQLSGSTRAIRGPPTLV